MQKVMERAKALGFSGAAVMRTRELVVVEEYRKYCEQNLCGCYGRLDVCPPACGSVEEMRAAMSGYDSALILQTACEPGDAAAAKRRHNLLTEELLPHIPGDTLVMGAGPWKTWSCMSVYCVDAQRMADSVSMLCWADDGLWRFFSLILFHGQE